MIYLLSLLHTQIFSLRFDLRDSPAVGATEVSHELSATDPSVNDDSYCLPAGRYQVYGMPKDL